MDVIRISGLRAMGRHGANPGERDSEQPFDIEVVLKVDLRRAQKSDKLEHTIDYDVMCQRMKSIVETTSFDLIERLAGELLEAALSDERVSEAEVSISKPGILAGATPSVTLRRPNLRFRSGT
ncbi:MAG: dihydroneopterin aldolase [Candidatus Eremiobacteraeota bacterium]|nr:dihydroneopterin aldolase [Candidatus Eremiobacteraeota bacterium]